MAETEMAETADYDKSADPTAHASSHESGGADAIDNLGPLTGLIISDDGVITWQGASLASSYLFDLKVAGDTQPRFRIRADGQIEWGSGSSALDTEVHRSSPGTLRFSCDFYLANAAFSVFSPLYYSSIFDSSVSGEAFTRFSILADGQYSIGPGSAARDCFLTRRAANIFNTPDRFEVGTLGVANSAAGTTPGTCQNKAEIFDAAGNSLGFIAIYDAIT